MTDITVLPVNIEISHAAKDPLLKLLGILDQKALAEIFFGKQLKNSISADEIKTNILKDIFLNGVADVGIRSEAGWTPQSAPVLITELRDAGLVASKGEFHLSAGPKLKEFARGKINDSEYRSILVEGTIGLGLRSASQIHAH